MNVRRVILVLLLLAGCSKPADPVPTLSFDIGADGSPAADTAVSGDATTSVDVGSNVDATDQVDMPPAADMAGMADNRRPLGQIWNTYYWLSPESDYPGPKTVELMNEACEPIATVSTDYADAACIEGSGLLEDGRVINYASICNCGRPCSSGAIICWKDLDPTTHPWGEGAFSNALVPARSLAVDPAFVALRTVVYIEQFDGVEIPALGGVAAFTHDGCFRADDVGGAIDGNHVDIFAASPALWRHLETVFPTRTDLDAWVDVAKCSYLEI